MHLHLYVPALPEHKAVSVLRPCVQQQIDRHLNTRSVSCINIAIGQEAADELWITALNTVKHGTDVLGVPLTSVSITMGHTHYQSDTAILTDLSKQALPVVFHLGTNDQDIAFCGNTQDLFYTKPYGRCLGYADIFLDDVPTISNGMFDLPNLDIRVYQYRTMHSLENALSFMQERSFMATNMVHISRPTDNYYATQVVFART